MSMLHPRFNHLGRSKPKQRKAFVTPELRKAKADHERFLKSVGLDPNPPRRRLKGVVADPLTSDTYRRSVEKPVELNLDAELGARQRLFY